MSPNPLPNVGTDLIRIHKVVTRALEVSKQNSLNASLPDEVLQSGFASYVRSLIILLHEHHAGEDELAFPFWRTRLPDGPFERSNRAAPADRCFSGEDPKLVGGRSGGLATDCPE